MIKSKKAMLILRALCLVLVMGSVLGCFVACDGAKDDQTTQTTEQATEGASEGETQDPADVIYGEISDDDVNWGGGDFTILASGYNEDNIQELVSEDKSGDPLSDAVYERNLEFEAKCNLELGFVQAKDKEDAFTQVRKEVQGNNGDIQYITVDHATTASLAIEGNLYNFLDLDMDLEQYWWDQGTYSFNLEGNVFFMNGSWNFSDDRLTWCMLFNKKAYELQAYKGEDANPYQLVLDGKWTLAKFSTLIQNFSSDDGDGKWDENDKYGFIATPHYTNAFFFSSGLHYVNLHDDGYPTMALSDDNSMMLKATELVEQVITIYTSNNATYRAKDFGTSFAMFKNNQGLFYGEAVSYVINLNKQYDGAFGVLPVPKYNEKQTDYYTYTMAFSSTLSIPNNVANTDIIGDITQVFAIRSDKKVRPAFYDIVLTSKSVKDEDSIKMLDILYEHRIYDLANYFDILGLNGLFEKSAEYGNNNFAHDHRAAKGKFVTNIRKLFNKVGG